MAGWLSRIDFLPSEFLHSDYLNYLGQDVRVWGGDVNGGGHRLSNVILDGVNLPPGSSDVTSVFGRTGAVVAVNTDYTPAFIGAVPVARQILTPAGSGLTGGGALSADLTLRAAVLSWNTRTGAITPAPGDYTAAQVTNAVDMAHVGGYADPAWITSLSWAKIANPPVFVAPSTQIIAGPGLSGGGPLTGNVTLSAPVMVGSGGSHAAGIAPDPGATAGSARYLCENGSWAVPPGSGGGAVSSVFGRTGAVYAMSSDYSTYYAPAGVVFGPSGATHAVGLVPDPGVTAGAARFLCENGNWATPSASGSTYWQPGNAGAIYYSTGNVGIYNSAPSNALSIGTDLGVTAAPLNSIAVGSSSSDSVVTVGQSGTSRGRMVWRYNATPASAYMAVGVASGTNPLVLQDQGGNVGIGTTSPQSLFSLNASAAYGMSFSVSGTEKIYLAPAFAANAWVPGSAINDLIIRGQGNNILFSTDSGVTCQMVLKNGGNVGIGTTSPQCLLDLAGPINVPLIRLDTTYSAVGNYCDLGWGTPGGTNPVSGIRGRASAGGQMAFDFILQNGGSQSLAAGVNVMTIVGNGNVGIGQATPGYPLHISSSTGVDARIRLENTSAVSTANTATLDLSVMTTVVARTALMIQASFPTTTDATRSSLVTFQSLVSGGFWNAIVLSGQNVGIGALPAATLDVAGMIRSTALVTPTSGAGVEVAYDGSSIGYVNAYDRTAAAFKALYVRGVPLCLNNLGGGNVGIGTSAPTSLLDCAGVIRTTSQSGPPTSGAGIEVSYNTTIGGGLITGYDRTASGYRPLYIRGLPLALNDAGGGSVGIGATAPESTFAVHGSHSNAALNSSVGSIATFASDTTVQLQFGAITGNSYAAWIQAKVDGQNAAYPIVLQPAGGLVGIGLYVPWALLTVQSAGPYVPSLTFATAATSTASIQVANGVELAMSQDPASPYGWWMQARGSGNLSYPILLNPMGGVVGIGTRVPSYALHIVGDCNITGTYRVNGTAISAGSVNAYNNGTLVNSTPGLDFINSTGSSASVSWTTGPPARCTVQFTYTSDERTKRNIEDLAGGISIIEKLRPVSFEFNGLANTTEGRQFIGVTAQHLREVIPTAVGTYRTKLRPDDEEESEVLDTDPHQITAHLVLAVQQLSKRIQELEQRLEKEN